MHPAVVRSLTRFVRGCLFISDKMGYPLDARLRGLDPYAAPVEIVPVYDGPAPRRHRRRRH